MPNVEAPVGVSRNFDPLAMRPYEFGWIFHDIKGRHSLAFENQVLSVKYQFNLSEEAATRVVEKVRPNPVGPPEHKKYRYDYFLQLGKEIGREEEIENVFDQGMEDTPSKLWAAIYGVDEAQLRPLLKKRLLVFKTLKKQLMRGEKSEVWANFHGKLLAYYEGLKEVISAQPATI